MNDNFLPKELVQKCFLLIESTHKSHGFGNLPARMTNRDNMVPLALIPDSCALMGSVSAAFKLRILSWVAGLAVLIAGLLLSRWILLGLVVVLLADRKLVSSERRQWMLLAAFLLALEMLASDFAGWASAYPQERKKALAVLGDSRKSEFLDFYLPRRNEIDSSLLKEFGPQ